MRPSFAAGSAAGFATENRGRDSPLEMRPRFAAGIVVGICWRNCGLDVPPEIASGVCRRKCSRDLPPGMQPGFAARNDHQEQKCENATAINDRTASPEKERVTTHQEVKNLMLTCLNINYVFLSPGTKS